MSEDGVIAIVRGPGKFNFSVGFFNRFEEPGADRNPKAQLKVRFTTNLRTSRDSRRAGALVADVAIHKLEWVDEGETLAFTGICSPGLPLNRLVEGEYSLKTGKGFIKSA